MRRLRVENEHQGTDSHSHDTLVKGSPHLTRETGRIRVSIFPVESDARALRPGGAETRTYNPSKFSGTDSPGRYDCMSDKDRLERFSRDTNVSGSDL